MTNYESLEVVCVLKEKEVVWRYRGEGIGKGRQGRRQRKGMSGEKGDRSRTDQAPFSRILQASWGFRRTSELLASGCSGWEGEEKGLELGGLCLRKAVAVVPWKTDGAKPRSVGTKWRSPEKGLCPRPKVNLFGFYFIRLVGLVFWFFESFSL